MLILLISNIKGKQSFLKGPKLNCYIKKSFFKKKKVIAVWSQQVNI